MRDTNSLQTTIVHQEGEQLIAAQRQRARAILAEASRSQLTLLGPSVADPEALTWLVNDDPPFDESQEAQAEWIATGFAGCEPAFPLDKGEPREFAEALVIVDPDEVKTKAQPM